MKSIKWFLGLGFVLFVLLVLVSLNSCQHLSTPVSSPIGEGSVKGMEAGGPAKAWTLLFYLDGDNDLDSYGQQNIDQIASAMTSDQDINVVVLYDHLGAPAELLQVTAAGVVKLADYGEPDMGNPATLHKFLTEEAAAFPATHYMVIIWSHGNGWKAVCRDSTSGSKMMLDGLAQSMEAAAAQIGREKFDITLFDACLMSMVEVVHQLKNATSYMVASESSVEYGGFPYDTMIKDLVENPTRTPADYAKLICDFYITRYAKSKADATAFDESNIQPLVKAINDFAVTLIKNMAAYRNEIGKARSNAKCTAYGTQGVFWFDDLKLLVNSLAKSTGDPTLEAQAAAINAAMDAALYERHTSQLEGKQTGLSINFPANYTKYTDKNWMAQNYAGIGLFFPAETQWDEMLLAYYGK